MIVCEVINEYTTSKKNPYDPNCCSKLIPFQHRLNILQYKCISSIWMIEEKINNDCILLLSHVHQGLNVRPCGTGDSSNSIIQILYYSILYQCRWYTVYEIRSQLVFFHRIVCHTTKEQNKLLNVVEWCIHY